MLPENEKVLDLLAAEATQGLSPDEARELDELLRHHPEAVRSALHLAAAAVDLAHTPGEAGLPPHLRSRLEAAAERWSRGADGGPPVAARSLGAGPHLGDPTGSGPGVSARSPVSRFIQGAGWFAATVCLLLAVLGWWPRLVVKAPVRGLTLVQQRERLLICGRSLTTQWVDWEDSEIKGVHGDVVWCPSSRRGFLRFRGMPRNDPAREQYQVWVVDDRGRDASGQPTRISVGVFDGGPEEFLVPIEAPVDVGRVELFAVTIEEPGGVATPDLKRFVVMAPVKG